MKTKEELAMAYLSTRPSYFTEEHGRAFMAGYSARAAEYAALMKDAEKLAEALEVIQKPFVGPAVDYVDRAVRGQEMAWEALTAWRENYGGGK